MKLTYYGHSCFEVESKSTSILFDPFISGNSKTGNIDISSLKPDFIFLSHGHADHTADAVTIAQSSGATVVGAYEVTAWMNKKGVEKYHPMNTGGKWTAGSFTVRCVNAVHSSSMPDGSYGGNPMGFVFTGTERSFYYSGDTALTLDMQLIPSYASLDLAILPIGDNFTMGVDDAVRAAEMVRAKKVVGVHYDTFDLILLKDKTAAKKAFSEKNIELLLPDIGETILV